MRTLSALIRIGSTLYPQARGSYIKWVSGEPYVDAFGAAWVALFGQLPKHTMGEAIPKDVIHGVGLSNFYVQHPMKDECRPLMYVIVNLNDYYRWPREKIADWLESEGL